MDLASNNKYKNIQVADPVWVEEVVPISRGQRNLNTITTRWNILIMGPTGAGKSAFIQALGLRGTESISSNKLDGFTQKVSAYFVGNVTYHGGEIYLVDSPGFADTRLSEMKIASMLKKWLRDNNPQYFDRIIDVIPITNARFPASQRRVLETFEALTGVSSANNITIVTTKWDSIWGERTVKRAEDTFMQFRDDLWQEFVRRGSQIVKFENTQDSSLSVLDDALYVERGTVFRVEQLHVPLHKAPFIGNLITNLKERIQCAQREISNHRSDLEYAVSRADTQLQTIIHSRLGEAEQTLVRFQMELHEFLHSSTQDVKAVDEVEMPHVDNDSEDSDDLYTPPVASYTPFSISHKAEYQGSHMTSPTTSPIPVPLESSLAAEPTTLVPTMSNPAITAGKVQPTQDVPQGESGWFERFTDLMCCGKAVGENHET